MRAQATRWLGLATAAVFAFALPLGAAADDAPSIVALSGTVEIGSGEPPQWRPAREGDALLPGDRVRTRDDGRAEIALRTGTARLYERSLLRLPLDPPRPDAEAVALEEGSSLFDVPPRQPRRDFEVHTPEAVAMVKGTRFGVALDDSGAAVSVFRGLVGVRGLAGRALREVLVRPGATGVGGASRPFELRYPGGSDPWGAWSAGGAPPLGPHELGGAASTPDAATRAGEALRALAESRLSALAPGEPAGPASADLEEGEGAGIGARGPGFVDRASREVIAGVSEAQLNGGTGTPPTGAFDIQRLTSGGPNRIQITDPGGTSVQLTEQDLQQIQAGNFTLYGPVVLGTLATQGVDPAAFATQLLDIL